MEPDELRRLFCEVHRPSPHDDPSEWRVCPCCEAVHQSERADSMTAQVVRLREQCREASEVVYRLTDLIPDGKRNWASDNLSGPCNTNIREALANTEAAAMTWLEAHDREVVKRWLTDNVPERYQYASGPDGTPESAFVDLCKDALQAMPGNQHRQQLAGARKAFAKLDALWLATTPNSPDMTFAEEQRKILEEMESSDDPLP